MKYRPSSIGIGVATAHYATYILLGAGWLTGLTVGPESSPALGRLYLGVLETLSYPSLLIENWIGTDRPVLRAPLNACFWGLVAWWIAGLLQRGRMRPTPNRT